jgi:hypothetical protein
MSLILSGDSPKISADSTGVLTSGTAVASTSGTSIDFTDIPSWVKRITVMFNGVSTNGASNPLVQLGDSGGIENTSYIAQGTNSATTGAAFTTGFGIFSGQAANVIYGTMTITALNSNTWIASFCGGVNAGGTPLTLTGGGSKTLSDVLTQIRITTVNGTDTFDAGSINILYE